MNDTDKPLVGLYGFSLAEFQNNRGWFLALGILLVVAGSLAIVYDVAATILSVLFFGWLLIIAGAFETVQSFWQPKWGGLFLHLMVGILAVVVGFHLVTSPAAGALVLTLIMAIYFMVIGIFRIITALAVRFPNWGWILVSGLITFILGIMIKSQWPMSGLWIIGLFIGIDMIFSGWSYIMLSLAAKKARVKQNFPGGGGVGVWDAGPSPTLLSHPRRPGLLKQPGSTRCRSPQRENLPAQPVDISQDIYKFIRYSQTGQAG